MLKKLLRVENIFAIVCLIWGSVFLLINPPFQAPDEDAHLFKMWGYTQGSLNFKIKNQQAGNIIPSSFVKLLQKFEHIKFDMNAITSVSEIKNAGKLKLEKSKTQFYAHTPSSYTPVSYFPAFIVLFFLKYFNIPPLFMIYILRFCCLLTYLAITYQAIKIMPQRKWLLFMIAILPTNLYIAGAINTDCLVISIAFLLIAYTLYLKSDEVNNIDKKQILLWGGVFTLLCVLKYLYFPMILLWFLLPKNKFTNKRNYIKYFTLIFIINSVYIFNYIYLNTQMYSYTKSEQNTLQMGRIAAIKFIFLYPLNYLQAILTTIRVMIFNYLYFVVSCFGWYVFSVPPYTTKTFYALLILCIFLDKKENKFNLTNINKFIMMLIFISIFLLILTSIFVIYNHFPVIVGMQGRYLSPVIPLIFLIFASCRTAVYNRFIPILIIFISQILLYQSAMSLIRRFFE